MMDAFTACPQCGALGPRRERCECGYPAERPGLGERALRRLPWLIRGRFRIFLIGVGAVICWIGFEEFRLSSNATAEPADVELAKLEAGEEAPQNHLRVGRHLALYSSAVYSFSERDEKLPNPPVRYSIYAIVSESHPFGKLMQQLAAAPDDAKEPVVIDATGPDRVAVLVKTSRFKNVGSIPRQPLMQDSVQGLAINQIHSLSEQEAELVRQVAPGVDLDKIIILEDGRRPKPLLMASGIASGGAILVLLGLAAYYLEHVFSKRDAAAQAKETFPKADVANQGTAEV